MPTTKRARGAAAPRPARVPHVRPPVSPTATRASAPLPVPSRAPRAPDRARANAPLAAETARGRAGLRTGAGEQALQKIFAPLPEGFRHGWIGDSGQGKSTANNTTIEAAIQDCGMICCAHDDTKLAPQIRGAVRASPAELASKPPTESEDATGALVFRGDPYAGLVVEVEEVAAFALTLARRRVPTMVVVDELDRACTAGGMQLTSTSFRTCLTQGRALGLCVSWTTQSPARAPKEVLDQATSIGIFRLGPRALNYVDERLCFDRELIDTVPRLQVGEFVLYQPGTEWDRTVYRFDL